MPDDRPAAAEMYKLLLETPHHPECPEQPVNWDLLFSGLSAPAPAAAQPGHVWPSTIIRGPSHDFAIECVPGLTLQCPDKHRPACSGL